ncbi:hypothetical protein FB451DRAFT_1188507 [Mycena latifolia]|nr:hypothetical protein FB451DRAFT_1188507 [Mycena latifolia]
MKSNPVLAYEGCLQIRSSITHTKKRSTSNPDIPPPQLDLDRSVVHKLPRRCAQLDPARLANALQPEQRHVWQAHGPSERLEVGQCTRSDLLLECSDGAIVLLVGDRERSDGAQEAREHRGLGGCRPARGAQALAEGECRGGVDMRGVGGEDSAAPGRARALGSLRKELQPCGRVLRPQRREERADILHEPGSELDRGKLEAQRGVERRQNGDEMRRYLEEAQIGQRGDEPVQDARGLPHGRCDVLHEDALCARHVSVKITGHSAAGLGMASMNSVLAPDLIFEILDCLAVPLPFHQRSCNLTVIARCRLYLLFRRVMLPHNIYREPHLRATSCNSLPSFLEAIDPATERGRWLADSVIRRLPTSDPTALATALLRTPNLRHLDVTTISCDFNDDTLARIGHECGPRITSLGILQDFTPSDVQHMRIMHRLVAALPNLRLLEVTAHLTPSLPAFDPPPHLALTAVKFNTGLMQDVGPCMGPHPSVLSAILPAHAAELCSLSIKSLAPNADPASVLAFCMRLERLELGHVPDATTLACLPCSIATLAIAGAQDDEVLTALEQQLAAGAFPQLKVLTWSVLPPHAPLLRLQSVCEAHRIELRTALGELVDNNAVEVELRRRYIWI